MWKEFFAYGLLRTLAAGTGAVYTDNPIRIDSDADFEFQKTCYHATNGNIRVRYRDDSSGRYLIKTSANLRTIGGNFAGTPFIWPRPYVISAGTTLTIELADNSGIPNTLRLAFHGAKIRPGTAPWERRFRGLVPFVYSTGADIIPANAAITLRIEVDNDAHFLVQKLTGFKSGSCTVSFREGARDRDWQNQAVHFDALIGNGQFPNVMFANRFIYRGSVITIDAQDLSGFNNDIEINLVGVKLYE